METSRVPVINLVFRKASVQHRAEEIARELGDGFDQDHGLIPWGKNIFGNSSEATSSFAVTTYCYCGERFHERPNFEVLASAIGNVIESRHELKAIEYLELKTQFEQPDAIVETPRPEKEIAPSSDFLRMMRSIEKAPTAARMVRIVPQRFFRSFAG